MIVYTENPKGKNMKNYIKVFGIFLILLLCLTAATACKRPDPSTIQHNWSEWEVLQQPSCEKDGMRLRVCQGCKKEQTEPIPALGHDYYLSGTTQPSCLYAGYENYQCSRCDSYYKEEIPALGHDFKVVSSQDPISCTKPGFIAYECTRCHATYSEILTTGHSFDQWSYNENYHWKNCSYCNEMSEYASHTFDGDFCTVCGYSRSGGLLRFEKINGNALKFIGFSEYTEGDVSIPASYNGLPVVSIGRASMSNFSGGKITLPDTVTDLSENPFHNTFITGIYIGSGVTFLEPDAFSLCPYLESIEVSPENPVFYSVNNCLIRKSDQKLVSGCNTSIIPQGVKSIGNLAFQNSRIQSVNLPDSVTYLDPLAFENCENLLSLSVGSGLTFIDEGAFSLCGNLETISVSPDNTSFYAENNCLMQTNGKVLVRANRYGTIPQDTGAIGSFAFSGCNALDDITLPDSVQSIGEFAFEFCETLQSVQLGNSVTGIGAAAFEYCMALREITIPDSLKTIGNMAFASCSQLRSIRLPALQSVGWSIFSGCESLQTLILSAGSENVSADVFLYSHIQTIWCEDDRQTSAWNVTLPDTATVYWAGEWQYVDGIPTPNP